MLGSMSASHPRKANMQTRTLRLLATLGCVALTAANAQAPRFEMTYIYRGGVHLALKNPAAAAADFRQALAINPANQSARDALTMAEGQMRGGR